MPTINKQFVRKPAASSNGATGSLLSSAVPSTELKGFLRMVFYGQQRVGKTTLACQFAKPLLHISFEPRPTGGALSVSKMPGIATVRLTSTAQGLQICREIIEGNGKVPMALKTKGIIGDRFATYVVDGATSYQEIVLAEVMGWEELPEQLSFGMVGKERYQERAEKVKVGLRPFMRLPGDLIILAKEKDHNPPKDDYSSLSKLTGGTSDDYVLRLESYFAEDVGGSVADWLHDNCDYICRLYLRKEFVKKEGFNKITKKKEVKMVETGNQVRRLRTMSHTNFAAGFCSPNPDAIPEFIEAKKPEEMYAKIMKVIRGEKIV